jgi:hypothetical protein
MTKDIINFDIVICGSGPGGFAAAIAAARLGMHVCIIEKLALVGGMSTAGLVNPFMISTLAGKPLIKGIFEEVVSHLKTHKAAREGELFGQAHIEFDNQVLKNILENMLRDEKVKVILGCEVMGVAMSEDNVTKGVEILEKIVFGKIIIDATGNADIAYLSGAKTAKGRKSDGLMQPATLNFNLGGVVKGKMPSRDEMNMLYLEAKNQGEITCPREKLLWFELPEQSKIHFNTTRIPNIDGTKEDQVARGKGQAEQQIKEIAKFLKEKVSGFENSYISEVAQILGIRETRRIVGAYMLTQDDILEGRKFEDAIACANYPLDIHNPKGEGTTWQPLKEGVYYQIPYAGLIPNKSENLLMAGRAISVTHEAFSSTRVMPTCMAVGQAAGVAAALAVKSKLSPRKIKIVELQSTLIEQGAYLG